MNANKVLKMIVMKMLFVSIQMKAIYANVYLDMLEMENRVMVRMEQKSSDIHLIF